MAMRLLQHACFVFYPTILEPDFHRHLQSRAVSQFTRLIFTMVDGPPSTMTTALSPRSRARNERWWFIEE